MEAIPSIAPLLCPSIYIRGSTFPLPKSQVKQFTPYLFTGFLYANEEVTSFHLVLSSCHPLPPWKPSNQSLKKKKKNPTGIAERPGVVEICFATEVADLCPF